MVTAAMVTDTLAVTFGTLNVIFTSALLRSLFTIMVPVAVLLTTAVKVYVAVTYAGTGTSTGMGR